MLELSQNEQKCSKKLWKESFCPNITCDIFKMLKLAIFRKKDFYLLLKVVKYFQQPAATNKSV